MKSWEKVTLVFASISGKCKEIQSQLPFEEIDGIYGHTTVCYKGVLYIFGGCDRYGTFYDNFYTLDLGMLGLGFFFVFCYFSCLFLENMVWGNVRRIDGTPCARNFHSCSVYKGDMYLFGGKSNGVLLVLSQL